MAIQKLQLNYKYIHFSDMSFLYSKKKTKTFNCRNSNTYDLLGEVKWFGRWRQYCFFPNHETIFNSICLNDISNFLQQLNKGHKEKIGENNGNTKKK